MMTQRNLSNLFVLPCLLVGLVACGEKVQETAVAPARPKIKKAESAKVVTTVADGVAASVDASPPKYLYITESRRDPFQPFLLINRPVNNDVDLSAQTPLQQYDTLQYKLSAIIVGYGQPMAMLLAPSGKSYIVRNGMKIGKSGGSVIKITKEALFVEEKYRDLTDEIRTNMLEIKLPKREGV